MFSSTLRSRSPWSTILSSLTNIRLSESTTLVTTDLRLPGDISVILIADKDSSADCIKRIDRAIQGGESADIIVVIFLGSGVWEFQLLLDSTFAELVYLIPLFTLQELPKALERLTMDFSTIATTQATTESESPGNWTPARMLSLITNNTTNLSSHTTLVLHSLFPSLQALAHSANERSLEVLDDAAIRSVMEFLDVEFVFGG